ncbi:MAG: hypothetical protein MZU95_04920 [Desulfomicrobium escambiense]|nr:hypothetical protein [Desulfomicrobium escambiense]
MALGLGLQPGKLHDLLACCSSSSSASSRSGMTIEEALNAVHRQRRLRHPAPRVGRQSRAGEEDGPRPLRYPGVCLPAPTSRPGTSSGRSSRTARSSSPTAGRPAPADVSPHQPPLLRPSSRLARPPDGLFGRGLNPRLFRGRSRRGRWPRPPSFRWRS